MNNPLKLYTTPTCSWCKVVKRYLSSKNAPYIEVDVSVNPKERQDIINLTNAMTVPVLVRNDKFVVGFNAGQINDLIG